MMEVYHRFFLKIFFLGLKLHFNGYQLCAYFRNSFSLQITGVHCILIQSKRCICTHTEISRSSKMAALN